MSKFADICPNCGKRSFTESDECEHCGAVKKENFVESNILDSVEEDLSESLNIGYNFKFVFSVFFRVLIILFSLLVVPQFIKNSDLYVYFIVYFTILHILKDFQNNNLLKYFTVVFKYLGIFYFSIGLGSIISGAGLNKFPTVSSYFEIKNIYFEFTKGNAHALILIVFLVTSISYQILMKDHNIYKRT